MCIRDRYTVCTIYHRVVTPPRIIAASQRRRGGKSRHSSENRHPSANVNRDVYSNPRSNSLPKQYTFTTSSCQSRESGNQSRSSQ